MQAHGAQQMRSQQAGQPHKLGVMQPKTTQAAQGEKPPVSPPVYGPQAAPRVLQTKSSSAQNPHAGQAPRQPVAPPVYRPYLGQKAVQSKMASPAQPTRKQPLAPSVYHLQPVPKVLQTKRAGTQESPRTDSRTPGAPAVSNPGNRSRMPQRYNSGGQPGSVVAHQASATPAGRAKNSAQPKMPVAGALTSRPGPVLQRARAPHSAARQTHGGPQVIQGDISTMIGGFIGGAMGIAAVGASAPLILVGGLIAGSLGYLYQDATVAPDTGPQGNQHQSQYTAKTYGHEQSMVTLIQTKSLFGHLTVMFEWYEGHTYHNARVHYFVDQTGYSGSSQRKILNAKQATGYAKGTMSVEVKTNDEARQMAAQYKVKGGARFRQWHVSHQQAGHAIAFAQKYPPTNFSYITYADITKNCAIVAVEVLKAAGINVSLGLLHKYVSLPRWIGDMLISPDEVVPV